MAVSKAAQSLCDEPREVVEFCTNCPFDDCISSGKGCEEVRKFRKALKEGKEYSPPADWGVQKPKPEKKPVKESQARHYARKRDPVPEYPPPIMMVEEVPAGPPEPEQCPPMYEERNLLMLCNLAIDALERLMDNIPELEWPPHLHAGSISLRQYRMQRFADLIDWAAIARGGKK